MNKKQLAKLTKSHGLVEKLLVDVGEIRDQARIEFNKQPKAKSVSEQETVSWMTMADLDYIMETLKDADGFLRRVIGMNKVSKE